jgi:hypothetical protein
LQAAGSELENWTYTPFSSSVGSHTVLLVVTDSASTPVTAPYTVASVQVNSRPSVTISPTSVIMDARVQTCNFTATVSGGTPPYSYQWYNDSEPVKGATNSSWIYASPSSDSYTVYVNVTDNATVPFSVRSLISSVAVNPQLAVTISPSSATIYADQNQTFVSSVSGGSSPCSYQWYLDGKRVPGATAWNWTFSSTYLLELDLTSLGSYNVYVNVTDDVGVWNISETATITLNSTSPVIEVTINPTAAAMDNGTGHSQVIVITNITGNTSLCMYQWYLQNSSGTFRVGADSSSYDFIPNSTGYYQVYVSATDSQNVGISNTAYLTVNSLPSIAISPTSSTIHLGESEALTSIITGGTSPYAYQWYLNGHPYQGANSSSWIFPPSSAGNYTVYVNATDGVGIQRISSIATVTVLPDNVAITNVMLSKTIVFEGDEATVSVTVSNQGNYIETFKVTVYANNSTGIYVAASQIITIPSGESYTIPLTWITTGFSYGNYTISANITLETGETNTWTGPYGNGTVTVTIPGDINGDGTVNGLDLAIMASAWLSTPGMPNWKSNADINGDGVVNGLDLGIMAQYWLQSY